MKKLISILLVVAMLATSLIVLTGCGEKEEKKDEAKKVEFTFEEFYKLSGTDKMTIKVKVPDNGKYSAVEKSNEEQDYKFLAGGMHAVVGNEKYTLEFSKDSYVYQTALSYKEAHGEKESNFKDYKEYMMGDEYTGTGKNFKELKIGNRDAIEYTVGTKLMVQIDIDDITTSSSYEIAVVPTDSNASAEDFANDAELNEIINSIVIGLK